MQGRCFRLDAPFTRNWVKSSRQQMSYCRFWMLGIQRGAEVLKLKVWFALLAAKGWSKSSTRLIWWRHRMREHGKDTWEENTLLFCSKPVSRNRMRTTRMVLRCTRKVWLKMLTLLIRSHIWRALWELITSWISLRIMQELAKPVKTNKSLLLVWLASLILVNHRLSTLWRGLKLHAWAINQV